MTEHKQPDKAAPNVPFTPEQEARLREIIHEEMVIQEKRLLHERRFGVSYPPKEHK